MRRLRLLMILALIAAPFGVGSCTVTRAKAPVREVLVLGGAGQLGAEIVRQLVARGERVTVLVRPQTERSRLASLPVQYVTGDALDPVQMAAVFHSRHFSVVVSALRVENGDVHFYEKMMTVLVAQAKAAGVSQIIHHSAVGAGANAANFSSLGWERVPGLLDRLRDQGVGEAILKASHVPFTIIRNTRLYPDGTPATGNATLTTDDTVILPMTRADLARLTLQCLGNAACDNQTYHVRDTSLAWPPPGASRR